MSTSCFSRLLDGEEEEVEVVGEMPRESEGGAEGTCRFDEVKSKCHHRMNEQLSRSLTEVLVIFDGDVPVGCSRADRFLGVHLKNIVHR